MAECLLKLDPADTNQAMTQLTRAIEINSNSVSAKRFAGGCSWKQAVSKKPLPTSKSPIDWMPLHAVLHITWLVLIAPREKPPRRNCCLNGFDLTMVRWPSSETSASIRHCSKVPAAIFNDLFRPVALYLELPYLHGAEYAAHQGRSCRLSVRQRCHA